MSYNKVYGAATKGIYGNNGDDPSMPVDPMPISLDAPTLPPFLDGIITASWLEGQMKAVSMATETPRELSTLLGLAVIATCVQKTFAIEIEQGYQEPLNIWTCPALDSGNRKSATVKHMTQPLFDWEREQAKAMETTIAIAKADRKTVEDGLHGLRSKAARADGEAFITLKREIAELECSLPDVPELPRLWAQDVTPERLGPLMAEHGERMAIISDEGGLFDTLSGRYSSGIPNLDLMLQSHAGTPHRVDRGSRRPVFMQSPALTAVLSPQPDVLRGLAKLPGFRSRGFIARWLFALPASRLGHRTLQSCPVPAEVAQAYDYHIRALLGMTPREDGQPHILRLSSAAYDEWKSFQRAVEQDMREGCRFEFVTDWASKLPGAAARLAGILHCAQHATERPQDVPVSFGTMEAALGVARILTHHALAVFDLMAVDPTLADARKVRRWIERLRKRAFTARDCFQELRASFPTMDALEAVFAVLIERHYLFEVPQPSKGGPGRPASPLYRLNEHLTTGWTS